MNYLSYSHILFTSMLINKKKQLKINNDYVSSIVLLTFYLDFTVTNDTFSASPCDIATAPILYHVSVFSLLFHCVLCGSR